MFTGCLHNIHLDTSYRLHMPKFHGIQKPCSMGIISGVIQAFCELNQEEKE